MEEIALSKATAKNKTLPIVQCRPLVHSLGGFRQACFYTWGQTPGTKAHLQFLTLDPGPKPPEQFESVKVDTLKDAQVGSLVALSSTRSWNSSGMVGVNWILLECLQVTVVVS